MPRTYLQLQDEVLLDEFDATKYRTLVKAWINEAAQKIAREVQLPQLERSLNASIPAGTNTHAYGSGVPATDISVLTAVIDTTRKYQLTQVDPVEIDLAPAATGPPTIFALYGSTITFYPTPAATFSYRLRFEVNLEDQTLTADASALTFPDDYTDLLVHYARARAFAMEDDFEASNFEMNWYQQGLSRMRNQMQLRTRGRNHQIPGQLQPRRQLGFSRP